MAANAFVRARINEDEESGGGGRTGRDGADHL